MEEQQPSEQAAHWNGAGGRAWVEFQALLDQMLRPFEELLVQSVEPSNARRVLDVGCGAGSTTLAIARKLGQSGRCTGIDISQPMLAAARERAARENIPATFIAADAQRHHFEHASYDSLVSRFGVMFFDDPVQAFANLRQAASPGAGLQFVAWRGVADNAFMTTAERVAAPLLPDLPSRRADEPGQFAFADRERIRTILKQSDWSGVDVEPVDVPCTLPESELMRYVTNFGLVGRVLHQANDHVRSEFMARASAAFAPYIHGTEVRFTGACWLVKARA